jgi:probable phosphoglycerate mutase
VNLNSNNSTSFYDTAAVILAAGLSVRMGGFKPLLEIGGKPALLRLLDSVRAAGLKTIVVVTGHHREVVEDAVRHFQYIRPETMEDSGCVDRADHDDDTSRSDNDMSDLRIDFIHNDDYEQGMFTSVKTGIGYAAEKGSARVLLFPVDVPLVAPETIRSLLKTYASHICQYNDLTPSQPNTSSPLAASGSSHLPFAVPVYKGKNGHPLLIPAEYFGEILAYEGEGGLKAVRSRYDGTLIKVETDDEGCTLDMDTPQDYEKLKMYYLDVRSGSALDARGTRIFLVRHGQPEQHSGKIFLGQADVPLSDVGREEAKEAGDRLAALGAHPARLYASDLSRALETAEIIAEKLHVPVEPDKLFREMAMGNWDGELIEDIRRKFPEEYEKRGTDRRNYRTPGGENFYELRGRVTREFYRLLVEEVEDGRDLVIVAHLGVIVVLTEELGLAEPGVGNSIIFPTGSVTEVYLPQ